MCRRALVTEANLCYSGIAATVGHGQSPASVATPRFLDSRARRRPLPPRPGTPNAGVVRVDSYLQSLGGKVSPGPPAIAAHLQASHSGCMWATLRNRK